MTIGNFHGCLCVYFSTMLAASLGGPRTYVQCEHVEHVLQSIMFWDSWKISFITAWELGWTSAFVTTLQSLRTPMIVHHNYIYIKSIVIFEFMKLAIKLLIVITCFLVYCLFMYNIVVPWPFYKYFQPMQFPPILAVLKTK